MPDETRILSAIYPGANGIQSAIYVHGHGYTPSAIQLSVFPESVPVGIGDVTISDGVGTITIPSCRAEMGRIALSPGGNMMTVSLLDRRWMWRYGAISGHYNIPAVRIYDVPKVADFGQQLGNLPTPDPAVTPDQYVPQIQAWTVKSAYDLGKLLFDAMGEKSYDLGPLPKDQFPEVNWQAANPAKELQDLAERFGCRLIYNFSNDRASIVRLGVGAQLPPANAGELSQVGAGAKSPVLPLYATCYGAPILFQVMFLCEAVGEDFDGRYKPIDELSYAPISGWGSYISPFYQINAGDCTVAEGKTIWDVRAIAERTVYRYYRILQTMPSEIPQTFRIPPDSDDPLDIFNREDIILTVLSTETSLDDIQRQRVRQPAKIYGRAILGGLNLEQTSPIEQIRIGFSVDANRQVIILDQAAQYTDQLLEKVVSFPSTIYLECAVMVRDPKTHQLRRYRRSTKIKQDEPAKGSPGELALLRDDVRLTVRTAYLRDYNPDTGEVTIDAQFTETNKPEADAKADYHIAAELAKLQYTEPQEIRYNGIKPIMLDGAIQQTTYQIGPSGAFTYACRDTEKAVWEDPYIFRRHREELSLENAMRNKPLALALADKKVDLFYGEP